MAFGETDGVTLANLERYLVQFQVDRTAYGLFRGDFRRTLETLGRLGQTFDWAYLDPPYTQGLYEAALRGVGTHLLKPQGRVIAEHEAGAALPPRVGPLMAVATRRYGKTSLTFYERGNDG